MNLKKIALSFSVSSLLFVSTSSLIAQETNQNSEQFIRTLPTLLSFLLDEDTCEAPAGLTIESVQANGNQGDNFPSNAIDNNVSTRWSSDAANPASSPLGTGTITFELASSSIVTDLSIAWFRSEERSTFYSIERSTDNVNWVEIVAPTESEITDFEDQFETIDVEDARANYIRIIGTGNNGGSLFTSISEVDINGCEPGATNVVNNPTPVDDPDFGLDPNLQPWENFDLSIWGLDSPALRDTDDPSRGTRIEDYEFVALREGASNDDFEEAQENFFGSGSSNDDFEASSPYFFTATDGGMVFKSPVDGGRTSSGARFPRSELREYFRGGEERRNDGTLINVTGSTENNWVLGYQPDDLELRSNAQNVGGRNGRLTGTLRVNKVTETGRSDDIGVTIIGQIHAESDEPLRLYYRKLPQNELGSIYFLHEIREDMDDEESTGRDGDDLDEFVLVGSRSDNASNPVNGIALDELFSYEIINDGPVIEVILRRGDFDGEEIARDSFNMATLTNDGITGSGYDRANEWMYFKAGAYTQNNVAVEDGEAGAATTGFGPDGTEADYDQVTFYRLGVEHDVNDCSQCSD